MENARRRPPEPQRGPPVYTVRELTAIVRSRLERLFPSVGVRGEVSNLSQPRSGHLYFSLKDRSASLRVVMFRTSAQRLRFRLQDGLKICAFGALGVYPQRGDYQLIAEHCEPEGVGALQLAFEQLKRKLAAEGLFDPRHKKPLPRYPRTIGVVTSPTGAALRDISSTLRRRWPLARLLLSPASVQGDNAARELALALRRLDRSGLCEVIIVGRGGGSLEDLWAFNEEVLVREIFRARTPIVSAVGHETDLTLSDAVADRRAVTPTAGAELVAPDARRLRLELERRERRLRGGWLSETRRHRERLRDLGRRLTAQQPQRRLQERAQHLDMLRERLAGALMRGVSLRRERLVGLRRSLALASPKVRLQNARTSLREALRRLRAAGEARLSRSQQRLRLAAVGLSAKSPLAVLARGYSLTTLESSGAIVTAPGDAPAGSRLKVYLKEGSLRCRVLGPKPTPPPQAPSAQATFGDWL